MLPITISILTYNRAALLKELLDLLSAVKYERLEIIVIDNCSEDETQRIISEEFPQVIYEKLSHNIGAAARNVGLKMAKNDVVITIDDDIVGIDDSALHRISTLFLERARLGALNFKVIDYYTGEICNWAHHRDVSEYSEREFCTYEITEGAVAFRKGAFAKTGYYPENFFLSHEGPDLALRLINVGYDVIYSNTVTVRHKHSDLGRRRWQNYYFDTRNQLWVAARNLPFVYAFIYLFRGLSSMLFYSLRDGYFLYWLKGIGDGLKEIKVAFKDRKVLSKKALSFIRHVDSHRPSLTYCVKERILKRSIRL